MKQVNDIQKLLLAEGWIRITSKQWVKGDTILSLSEEVVELLDTLYNRGFIGGLHRGLYEQETMEDVEAGDQQALAEARANYLALASRQIDL